MVPLPLPVVGVGVVEGVLPLLPGEEVGAEVEVGAGVAVGLGVDVAGGPAGGVGFGVGWSGEGGPVGACAAAAVGQATARKRANM